MARPGDPGKAYLGPFGHAVVDAALKTPRAKWVALATALQRGAAEKHIVLHFNDSQLEQLVADAGIGGVLPQRPTGDAVLVADSNLSGPKATCSSHVTTTWSRPSTRRGTSWIS